jgi:hypothetical protein
MLELDCGADSIGAVSFRQRRFSRSLLATFRTNLL